MPRYVPVASLRRKRPHTHHAYSGAFRSVPRFGFGTYPRGLDATAVARDFTGAPIGVQGANLGRLLGGRYGTLRPGSGLPARTYQRGTGYGDASAGSSGGSSITDLLNQYAPVVNSITGSVLDPRRQRANVQAKLDKAIAKGAPQWEIDKYRGQLAALDAQIAEKEASVAEGQAWQSGITRNLWVVTGIGVGVMALVGVAAYRNATR